MLFFFLPRSATPRRRLVLQSPPQRRSAPLATAHRRRHRSPPPSRTPRRAHTTADTFLEADERSRRFERERWEADQARQLREDERERDRNALKEKELNILQHQIDSWSQIANRVIDVVERLCLHHTTNQ